MLQSSSVICACVSSIVNRKMSYYTQSGHLISNHVTVILYIVREGLFSLYGWECPVHFLSVILGPFNRGWMCHVTCVVRCLNHEVTSHDLLLASGQVPGWWYSRSCRLLCKIVSCPVYVKTGLIQLFPWCDVAHHISSRWEPWHSGSSPGFWPQGTGSWWLILPG